MSAIPKVAPKRQGQRMPRLDSLKNPQPRPPPQAANSQRTKATTTCTNPECTDSMVEEEDGKLVCIACGTVLQEMHIVSEIQFNESAGGAATVQGSRVGADQTRARAPGGQRLKMSGVMESSEITDANGRRYINQLGAALNIPVADQERGLSLFKLAARFNFIQGRRTKDVAAVCLYITCRMKDIGSSIMLIDLSDVLMLNVFKLGQVYSALLRAFHIHKNPQNVQLINPEALIERFSKLLEFGDSQMRVAKEAIRIVQRMNRDWILTGRRPAGICGGALILAARMNNFRRTVREVSHIVKVAEATILKRLDEFKVTESSGLTVEEFRTIDLEHACDPPAFYEQKDGKKKRTRKRKVVELEDEEPSGAGPERAASAVPPDTSGQLETPADTQSQAQNDARSMPPPPVPIDPALLQVSAERLSELQSSPDCNSTSPSPSATNDNAEPPAKRKRGRPPGKVPKPPPPTRSELEQEAAIESEITDFVSDPSNIAQASALHSALDGASTSVPFSPPPTQKQPTNKDLTSETQPSLSMPPPPTTENPSPPKSPNHHTTTASLLTAIPSTPIIPDTEFEHDLEVENCLLSPAEIAIKERIWVHENKDYLRAQSAKLLKQQLAEQNGTARTIVRRKRRRGRMGDVSSYGLGEGEGEEGAEGEGGDGNGEGNGMRKKPRTPAEATKMMMKKRGYSRKINYSAIDDLYTPSSRSSSRRTSVATSITGSPGLGQKRDGSMAPSEVEGSVVEVEGATAAKGKRVATDPRPVDVDAGEDEEDPDDYVEDQDNDDEEVGQTLEEIVQELRDEGELEDDDDADGGDDDYD